MRAGRRYVDPASPRAVDGSVLRVAAHRGAAMTGGTRPQSWIDRNLRWAQKRV
jgi:hypothetical protein